MGGNPLPAIFTAAQTGQQYSAEGDEGKFAVQQDQQNANIADTAASDTAIRGQIQAGLARIHGTDVQAQQKVGYAASGVDTSQGTPLQTAASTGVMSNMDVMTIQSNAAREAWGYQTKGDQFRQKAKMDAQRMQNQQTGTLLSGMSKFASMGGGGGGGDSGGGDSQSTIDAAFNSG